DAFEGARPAAGARPPRAARKGPPAPRVGQRLACRIVSVSGDALLLDIGARSEAVEDAREVRAEDGSLNVTVGQTGELFVGWAGASSRIAAASGSPRWPGGRSWRAG